RVRDGLRQQRLDAAAEWADAELDRGAHRVVVERLREQLVEFPLAEPVVERLMRALYLAGRDTEALEVYARTRERTADDLGTEPGPALRELHRTILRRQPVGDAAGAGPPAAATPAVPATSAVPAQLPPAVSGFVGRADDLARLDAIAVTATGEPTAVVIYAVSGTAGVGKTTLAVHWAHRVRRRFPDGQLYANLRGFDPSGPPMRPAEAVRDFLDALGVPQQRIPAGLDAQAALYRSLVADRRLLVVLDNARDA